MEQDLHVHEHTDESIALYEQHVEEFLSAFGDDDDVPEISTYKR